MEFLLWYVGFDSSSTPAPEVRAQKQRKKQRRNKKLVAKIQCAEVKTGLKKMRLNNSYFH
jgi:hypothetical protein